MPETVLITGASSGIGMELARLFAADKSDLILVARSQQKLEQLATELSGKHGIQARALSMDLADRATPQKLYDQLAAQGIQVDVLVNNAGFGVYQPFAESDRELELKQVRVLVEAVMDLMGRYIPGMVRRGRGAIINMSSTAGFQALPFNAGYAAAKAHVLLLSEAVHAEVKDRGVTVTAVCPGPVPSGFQETSDASYFAERLPKFTVASPERVARDALRAAERGRISVIPGGPQVRVAFGPNRKMPRWLSLPISKRLMARG